MAGSFELVWRSEGVERAFPVHGVVTIGRGPTNDLVLPGAEVSYQHARIWSENGTLWVVDTGSTNGVFVGAARITAKTELAPDSTVRLGTHTLIVQPLEGEDATELRWVIEDLASGVRRPFADRIVIGPGVDAHFRIEGAEAEIKRDDLGFWLETATERRMLAENVPESVGPLRLVLLHVGRRVPRSTVRPAFSDNCYHVEASLNARIPWAQIRDDTNRELEIEGEARATLVFVLARACIEDRARGISPSEEGWMDDYDLAVAIWGRIGRSGVGNKLSVVIYRLRADLKKKDMDGSFVERKRGCTRIRCGRVSLED